MGKDNVVGIVTLYDWNVRGSNLGGTRFSVWFRPALGPTQPPIQWVPGLFPGDKAAGA